MSRSPIRLPPNGTGLRRHANNSAAKSRSPVKVPPDRTWMVTAVLAVPLAVAVGLAWSRPPAHGRTMPRSRVELLSDGTWLH